MRSRILLNLLLHPKVRLSSTRLSSSAAQEQGYSLAVVLIAMFSVVVAGVAMANRTQTGRLASSAITSNREAREVAAAGVTHVISEWNRPDNRGMYTGLQPMSAWTKNNPDLKNPCNGLTPTDSATSDLAGKDVVIDANRRFRITGVTFSDKSGKEFSARPGISTPFAKPPFTPEQVDFVVEGTYQVGGNTNTARVMKRLGLFFDPNASCKGGGGGNGGGGAGDGLFTYGAVNPDNVPTVAKVPRTYTKGPNNTIVVEDVERIVCLPIAPPTPGINPECIKSITSQSTTIAVVPRQNLSQAQKDALNPPTIQSIAAKAGKSVPTAIKLTGNLTVDGTGSNCFTFNGAAHCNVSSIDMSGNKILTIDTSNQPVYLYTSGNITTGGKASIRHVNCGTSFKGTCSTQVNASKFSKFDQFQEAVFRFQVRGNPVTNPLVPQTFKFAGTPSANLLFWAPTATLDLRGTADFSAGLFVNRLETNGNTSITLVGQPELFIKENGDLSGGNGGFPARRASSTIFTKFF
jgi:hypothetical protein